MRRIIVIMLLLTGFSGSLVQAVDAEEITIVFIAYQNPDQMIDDVAPVVSYLEKATQSKIKSFVATDYAGVVEALRAGRADVGFMGPLQYVIAQQQSGARPILGEVYNGKATYQSKIFVRKDSGIKKLEDLKGKTIAFVDPISSSGYLYPLSIFKSEGLVKGKIEDYFKRVYFAGGDEQAIRAVFNDFVDAAGIGEFAYSLLRPEERDEVIVIGESQPIPSHCVVVRKGLAEATVKKLQDALLALNEAGPNHKLLKNLYSVDGYVRVTAETYAETRRLAKEYGLVK